MTPREVARTPEQNDQLFRRIGQITLKLRQLQLIKTSGEYTISSITLSNRHADLNIEIPLDDLVIESTVLDALSQELDYLRSEMLSEVNDYE